MLPIERGQHARLAGGNQAASPQKLVQLFRSSLRNWLILLGDKPKSRLKSFVRSSRIIALTKLLSRDGRVCIHSGKSTRNAAWSGTGVCVFSARRSSTVLVVSCVCESLSMNMATEKPCFHWATLDMTSFNVSAPARR